METLIIVTLVVAGLIMLAGGVALKRSTDRERERRARAHALEKEALFPFRYGRSRRQLGLEDHIENHVQPQQRAELVKRDLNAMGAMLDAI